MTDHRIDRGTSVVVIGAGPAGLMAAEIARRGGAEVTVYDRMPSAGRKFLLAGRGGLNLTHSEPFDSFMGRYAEAAARLGPALSAFTPADMRAWSAELGQTTFVGSSGRVFPEAFKASPLLRAWLRRLDGSGVRFRLRHHWTGWDTGGGLVFATPDGPVSVRADATILALGGASWPRLGSDGAWVATLDALGVAIQPLAASNCGVLADWSALFRDRFEGQPLKGIAISFGGRALRGEVVVTRTGLEGGAIYGHVNAVRAAIAAHEETVIRIALRPDLPPDEVRRRVASRVPKQSTSTFLRKAFKLSPAAIGLMNEARFAPSSAATSAPDVAGSAIDIAGAAMDINDIPVRLTGLAPIAAAISTAGGVRFDDLDDAFMLRRHPGAFVAGEMVAWDAPTGGYLMQACCATGAAAARGALDWLAGTGGRTPDDNPGVSGKAG